MTGGGAGAEGGLACLVDYHTFAQTTGPTGLVKEFGPVPRPESLHVTRHHIDGALTVEVFEKIPHRQVHLVAKTDTGSGLDDPVVVTGKGHQIGPGLADNGQVLSGAGPERKLVRREEKGVVVVPADDAQAIPANHYGPTFGPGVSLCQDILDGKGKGSLARLGKSARYQDNRFGAVVFNQTGDGFQGSLGRNGDNGQIAFFWKLIHRRETGHSVDFLFPMMHDVQPGRVYTIGLKQVRQDDPTWIGPLRTDPHHDCAAWFQQRLDPAGRPLAAGPFAP